MDLVALAVIQAAVADVPRARGPVDALATDCVTRRLALGETRRVAAASLRPVMSSRRDSCRGT